jgi:hypothetical protein
MSTDGFEPAAPEAADNRDFTLELDDVFHITTHHSVLCGRLTSGTVRLHDRVLIELDDGTHRQAIMTYFNVIVPGKTGGIFTTDDVQAPCGVCIQVLGVENCPITIPQTLRRKRTD